MTGEDLHRDVGPVATLDNETLDKARHTIASHAQNAGDLAVLLDMLGLGFETLCRKCGKKMSRPDTSGWGRHPGADGLCWRCIRIEREAEGRTICPCGRTAPRGETVCGLCKRMVPVEVVREVVNRIKAVKGWTVAVTAKKAGITPECLSSALAPTDKPRRTATANLTKLQTLAAEVGA